MNIPDEVGEQALKSDDTWVFIAEWARKEALREAAEIAVKSGQEWLDLWQPNARLPEVWDFIASDIRTLAEGDN